MSDKKTKIPTVEEMLPPPPPRHKEYGYMHPASAPPPSPRHALPEVFCIIPHFGDDAMLRHCHASLSKVKYPQELFSASSVLTLNNNPPHPHALFTASINAGIKAALKLHAARICEKNDIRNAPSNATCACENGSRGTRRCLLWLLNNDTVVDPNCILAAVKCFDEMGWENTGMVGPRNLLMENPDRIFWGGSKECYPAGKHKVGYVSHGDLAERTLEPWITFSSVFLNIEMVTEIGLLDNNLKHVFSDSDYSLRARLQGWRLYHEPTAVIYHAVGTSMRNPPESLKTIMHTDAEYFRIKWIEPGALVDYFDRQFTEQSSERG